MRLLGTSASLSWLLFSYRALLEEAQTVAKHKPPAAHGAHTRVVLPRCHSSVAVVARIVALESACPTFPVIERHLSFCARALKCDSAPLLSCLLVLL